MKPIFFIFFVLMISFSCSSSQKRDIKENSAPSEESIVSKDTLPKTLVEEILDDYQNKYTHRRPNAEKDSCLYFNFYLSYQDSCYYAIIAGDEVSQHFSVEYDRKTDSYHTTPLFIGYAVLGKYHVAIDWLKGREGLHIPAFLNEIQYIDAEGYVDIFVNSSFFEGFYDPYCCKYKIMDNTFTFEKGGYW